MNDLFLKKKIRGRRAEFPRINAGLGDDVEKRGIEMMKSLNEIDDPEIFSDKSIGFNYVKNALRSGAGAGRLDVIKKDVETNYLICSRMLVCFLE